LLVSLLVLITGHWFFNIVERHELSLYRSLFAAFGPRPTAE